MRKLVSRVEPWLLPVAMMALIFFLSSLPADKDDHGLLYVLSRKLAHLGEYATLMALWWRALATKLSDRVALVAAFAVTVGYAATDELHQTFVDGRQATPRDVGIDAVGALVAGGLIARTRLRKRIRV